MPKHRYALQSKRYRFHPQALSNTLKIYINKVVRIRHTSELLFRSIILLGVYREHIHIIQLIISNILYSLSIMGCSPLANVLDLYRMTVTVGKELFILVISLHFVPQAHEMVYNIFYCIFSLSLQR